MDIEFSGTIRLVPRTAASLGVSILPWNHARHNDPGKKTDKLFAVIVSLVAAVACGPADCANYVNSAEPVCDAIGDISALAVDD